MRWLLLMALTWAPACNKDTSTAGAECANNADCGDAELCLSEVCTPVDCSTSADCSLEQYCDGQFLCADGCAADSDCLAGNTCDVETNTCEPYGCRSTELDCQYGETCDPTTGACVASTEPLCTSCDVGAGNSACGQQGTCLIADVGDTCNRDSDCEAGQYCDRLSTGSSSYCHTDYCSQACNPLEDDPCPRGFTCTDVGNGQNVCFGDCSYMLDNGLLP